MLPLILSNIGDWFPLDDDFVFLLRQSVKIKPSFYSDVFVFVSGTPFVDSIESVLFLLNLGVSCHLIVRYVFCYFTSCLLIFKILYLD